MSSLYNEDTGYLITKNVQYEERQDVTLIENKALDGTHYLQIIGERSYSINAEAYVDRIGKIVLEAAQQSLAMLAFTAHGKTVRGRITGLSFSDRMPQGYFRADITAAEERA